jgi:putative hydrolase of the HAD superfamily
MTETIEAIFLDLGHTLRIPLQDEAHQAHARREIACLLDAEEDPEVFFAKLEARYEGYRRWALETMIEAPEPELWSRWLTPEIPLEKIAPLSAELTYQYRQSLGRRVVMDGSREVLDDLRQRGYTLGIISNLIGTREIPEWLAVEDYSRYFKSVVLSSVFGRRKPHPSIYLEAARQAGVDPAKCAYVGDNLKRDVTGTHAAGFGMAILLISPEKLAAATITNENRPDVIIHSFHDLLDIFPTRTSSHQLTSHQLLSQKESGAG